MQAIPTARVLHEWSTRGAREYGSGALAQHFTLWLLQLGVSPDLLRAGLDVVEDELRHAEMCRALVAEHGGAPLPAVAREGLELPRRADQPLERDVLRACLRSFCLDETTAVTMFQAMRRDTRVPQVREVIDHFLADEVQHREFGWVTLEWLLQGELGRTLRPFVLPEILELIALRRNYYDNPAEIARAPAVSADERAWGMLGRGEYVRIFNDTLAREVVPRLARLGFTLAL